MRENYKYCAFYCDENIWKLCETLEQESTFKDRSAYVVFVTNPKQSVAIWHQKTSELADLPVVFDYHVVLLVEDDKLGWQVWDLDTRLNFPENAETYFHETFSPGYEIPEELLPVFRLVSADDYLKNYSTDRSHMRDENGEWQQPPPEWEAPFHADKGINLFEYVQMEVGVTGKCLNGEVLELESMLNRYKSG